MEQRRRENKSEEEKNGVKYSLSKLAAKEIRKDKKEYEETLQRLKVNHKIRK